MAQALTGRYAQMLSALPVGRPYDPQGYIVPFTSSPQSFRFETNEPNTKFGVFVNNVYQGIVTTDIDGNGIVTATFQVGRNDISIVNATTQEPFNAYVDARRIATIYSAEAKILEYSDTEIEDIYNARSLFTVSSNYAEATYGKMTASPNVSDMSNRSYVNALTELRQAYRGYGGILRGLRVDVGAFTGSVPLLLPSAWKPAWFLGDDLLPNGRLQEHKRSYASAFTLAGLDLPNINSVSRSYVKASILSASATLIYVPDNQPPVAQRLTLTAGAIWGGGNVTFVGVDATGTAISETLTPVVNSTIATQFDYANVSSITKSAIGAGNPISIGTADSRFVKIVNIGSYNPTASFGLVYATSPKRLSWASGDSVDISALTEIESLTLMSKDTSPILYGNQISPFNLDPIVTSRGAVDHMDQIYLRLDSGPVVVDLSSLGVSATAAQVVTAINTKTGLTTAVEVIGTEGENGHIVELTSISTGVDEMVTIEEGAADASPAIFGLPRTRSTLSAISQFSLTLADASAFPVPKSEPKTVVNSNNPATDPPAPPQITGLSYTDVSDATTLGIGDLQLDISPTQKLLAYRSPQDSGHGVQQDVQTGGDFVLTSTNGIDTLSITVDASILNPSTVTQTLNNTIRVQAPGEYLVRIRGRRVARTDGHILAPVGILATFQSNGMAAKFSKIDKGGSIRITSSAFPGNIGIHPIVSVGGTGSITIQNGNPGGTFTAETVLTFAAYSFGEVHTVVGRFGNMLTLAEPNNMISTVWPTGDNGVFVEVADEMPGVTSGYAGLGTLDIIVDPRFEPSATSDSFTPIGVDIPDGWNVTNVASSKMALPGLIEPSRLLLRSTTPGTDVTFFRQIPSALDYAGLKLTASFWLREHSVASGNYSIDINLNGGTDPYANGTWLNGSTQAVTGTPLRFATTAGPLEPIEISREFFIPFGATSVWVRLRRIHDGSNPATFSVARAAVTSSTHTALYLGHNTIPRNAKRTNFEEVLYVWSPEQLTVAEDQLLGLVPGNINSTPTVPGQIDNIMPAHEYIERFDVSEYDNMGLPVNMAGIYSDADWVTNTTLINMEFGVGTPARMTYARPSRTSAVNAELLGFTAGVGGVDSLPLALPTAYEGATPPGIPSTGPVPPGTPAATIPDGNATVLELTNDTLTFPGDIETVPSTIDNASIQPWNWINPLVPTDNKGIHIDAAYFGDSSTYAINYNTMIRAESGVFALPSSMADYLWLIDVAYYTRVSVDEGSDPTQEQLTILGDFTATLGSRSDQNRATSVLVADTGLTKTVVAQALWSYVDSQTIRINSSIFDNNTLYSFSYVALYPRLDPVTGVRIDWRSASTSLGVASATYVTVVNNQIVNPVDIGGTYNQFHQIRVTLSNVTDARDVRIYSMGLRGLHLFGTPYAPGLILGPA